MMWSADGSWTSFEYWFNVGSYGAMTGARIASTIGTANMTTATDVNGDHHMKRRNPPRRRICTASFRGGATGVTVAVLMRTSVLLTSPCLASTRTQQPRPNTH